MKAFENSEANARALAAGALVTGLIEVLRQKGVLSNEDVTILLTSATTELETRKSAVAFDGALKILNRLSTALGKAGV